MGLDIFFCDDIRNALLAANEGSAATAAKVADLRLDEDVVVNLRAYREGYKAALCTVALAFGILPAVITGPAGEAGALAPVETKKGAPL